MDRLWTPWRYDYITSADAASDKPGRPGVPQALSAWPGDHQCVFCNLVAATDYGIAHGVPRGEAEAASLIVHRGRNCFVCLNAFPYSSGHLMVLPYAHLASLAALPQPAAFEMMDLAQTAERVLTRLYTPQGINMGWNLGKAAGAGVAGHLHLHALPRWIGDTNFMTTIAETRVIPEDLSLTWRRIRDGFRELLS